MDKYKKKLLLDLDGVLNTYNGQFDEHQIPEIKNGAENFLKKLSKNYKIKLFTTRDKKLATKWLESNNIAEYFYGITNIKESAYLYIDDRCVRFNGNYDTTITEIENFKPFWKK